MFWKNGDKLRKKDLTERGFYGMNLSGTRTEQNLLAAFAGESMAANKYDFYSSQAKKEGYEQIGAIFKETADNERQHAKQIFRFLNGIGTTDHRQRRRLPGNRYVFPESGVCGKRA